MPKIELFQKQRYNRQMAKKLTVIRQTAIFLPSTGKIIMHVYKRTI